MANRKPLIFDSSTGKIKLRETATGEFVSSGGASSGIDVQQFNGTPITGVTDITFTSNITVDENTSDIAGITASSGMGAVFENQPRMYTGSSQSVVTVEPFHLELPDNIPIQTVGNLTFDISDMNNRPHESITATSDQKVFNFTDIAWDASSTSAIDISVDNGGLTSDDVWLYLPFDAGLADPINDLDFTTSPCSGLAWDLSDKKLGRGSLDLGTSGYTNLVIRKSDVELDETVSFTFETWFKIDSVSTLGFIYDNRNASGGMYILANGSYQIRVGLVDSGTDRYVAIDDGLSLDTWYHLMVTYDSTLGVSDADSLKIYINNSLVDQTLGASSITTFASGSAYQTIGKYFASTTVYYFNGQLDNFIIWKKVLSTIERADAYNSGSGRVLTVKSPIPKQNNLLLHLNNSYTDENGNYTVTPNGTTTFDASTKVLGSHSVDITATGYLSVPDSLNIKTNQPFSVEMWVYPMTGGGGAGGLYWLFGGLRYWTGTYYRGIYGYLDPTAGYVQLTLYGATASSTHMTIRSDSSLVSLNNWYHLVFTYDGSGSVYGTKIYVNGTSYQNIFSNDVNGADISAPNNWIGRPLHTANYYFDGKMDEIVHYNYELSSSEVTARYNSGSGVEQVKGIDFTDENTITLQKGLDTNEIFTANVIEAPDQWYYLYITDKLDTFPNFGFFDIRPPNEFGEHPSLNARFIGSVYNNASSNFLRFDRSGDFTAFQENTAGSSIYSGSISASFGYLNLKKYFPRTAKEMKLYLGVSAGTQSKQSSFGGLSFGSLGTYAGQFIVPLDANRQLGMSGSVTTQVVYLDGYVEDMNSPKGDLIY